MSLNVISLKREFFPMVEKLKVSGEEYILYFNYKKDSIFSILEFCRQIKAKKCIIVTDCDFKHTSGSIIKEITYDKALGYPNLFSEELINRAKKNNIEIVYFDVNSLKTTKISNFIEHT